MCRLPVSEDPTLRLMSPLPLLEEAPHTRACTLVLKLGLPELYPSLHYSLAPHMTPRHHCAVTPTNGVSLVLVLFPFHRGLLLENKSQVRNSTPQPLWLTDACFPALFPHKANPRQACCLALLVS